jgi:RimJ/RimL family protein N-acetyltransferase
MIFVPNTIEKIELEKKIHNSQPQYNLLAHGRETVTDEMIRADFKENEEVKGVRMIIEAEGKAVGLFDYCYKNPNDGQPWIGLLLIQAGHEKQGYGKSAVTMFEESLRKQGYNNCRLGVLQGNNKAKQFWEKLGYKKYTEKTTGSQLILCYEKYL